MADAQRTIDLIFNGVDKTGAATQAVLNNLSGFGDKVETATQPIANFTAGALKLEAGILAAGTAMTLFAVKSASDFDAAFRQISTLFDAGETDVAAFRQAILDYAAGSAASLEDITNALAAAIGSGVEYSKSIDLISTAEKLAISTRADLKGTTEVLVSTLNAYGMSTDEAGAVSDKLFQIIKDGKIEMTDLSRSLANITPIAATAGISLDEIGAGIATLTAAGVQPSTAIDALRSAISNIIKPSEQAKALAAELGIEFDANALKSKGLAGVLNEVQVATGGSASQMAILFGDVQGLSAVMTLTGAQAGKFAESIKAMGGATGAVELAYQKMAESLDTSIKIVANAFKVLQVGIGDELLDEFGGIAKAIAEIFVALARSVKDGSLSELINYIEGLVGEIEAAFQQVAKNLPAALAQADLSGFKNGIDVIVGVIKELFDGVDLTTTDGLVDAIELLGAAFLSLSKYSAGVIQSFEPMFDLLVKIAKGAAEVDTEIFKLAGNFGGAVTQINMLAGGMNSLLPSFEALLNLLLVKQGIGIVGAMASLATGSGALSTALGKAGLAGAALAAGIAIGDALNEPLNKLISTLTGSKTTLGAWIYELINGKREAELFGDATDKQREAIQRLSNALGGSNFVWDEATKTWKLTAEASKNLADGLDGVEGAVKKVTYGPVTEYLDTMGNVVKRTVSSKEALDEWNKKMLESGGVMEDAADGAKKFSKSNEGVFDTTSKIIPIIDEATGKVIGYEQNLLAAADAVGKTGGKDDALKKTVEELRKAEEHSRQWALEMEKLASAETIAQIESATAIATARIEADAQKVTAAFESISNTVTSTGETLLGLYDILGSSGSSMGIQDWMKINKEIEKESERRDEALKLQNELTREQIEMLRTQREALERGDSLITIDGAGLQPHLEAFMWEILQAIQVRVNRDGLSMLLGV